MLSEDGEKAIARIEEICGKEMARVIRSGNYSNLSERAVCRWADQDNETVENLGKCLNDFGWSVIKTLNYLHKVVDHNTTVQQLILITHNHGRRFTFTYDNFRFIIEAVH